MVSAVALYAEFGRYNAQHETAHRGDAHSPDSSWRIRFISAETVAGRSVEKRRIRSGIRHSGTPVACHWFERYSTLGCRPSGSLDDKDEIVRTIQNPEAASVVVI